MKVLCIVSSQIVRENVETGGTTIFIYCVSYFVFVFVFCICICILCLCFIPDCEGDKKRMWRQMGQKRPLCSIFIQTIRLVAMIGTQPLSPFLYPSILNLSSDKKRNFHISTFLVSIHRKRWGLYIEG